MRHNDDLFPFWFKVWFAFCAVLGVAVLGVIIWAVITVVQAVTR